jgi:hypothetical protein
MTMIHAASSVQRKRCGCDFIWKTGKKGRGPFEKNDHVPQEHILTTN